MTVATDPRKTGISAAPTLLAASAATGMSITGTTNETTLATVTIPAGAMGLNGAVHIYATWTYTNSGNTKTTRIKFGGTAISAIGATTTATLHEMRRVRNRGSASSQVASFTAGSNSAFAASSGGLPALSVDTTAAVDILFTAQLTSTGETAILESYEVWLLP
jgi:hypothetical protein